MFRPIRNETKKERTILRMPKTKTKTTSSSEFEYNNNDDNNSDTLVKEKVFLEELHRVRRTF